MRRVLFWIVVLAGFAGLFISALLNEASSCQELEVAVRQEIQAAAPCETKSDCIALHLMCPFDCVAPVNVQNKSQVYEALGNYTASCMATCPECPKNLSRGVECIENRCRLTTAPTG